MRFSAGVLCVAMMGGVMAATASAHQGLRPREIRPPDVYARLELLAAELDLVRQEIGAPQDTRPAVIVKGGEPRQNYFEALSMCRKAQRLCFDLTGDEGTFPPPAPGGVVPADVLAVVEATRRTVLRIKTQFDIGQESEEPLPDSTKTPSDVFRAIVTINRQLSLMLDTRPSPTSVYAQLTEAVGTASRLLGNFADATPPATPEFERNKTPTDVHGRLMRCFDRLSAIMRRSGVSTLEIDWQLQPDQITPGDVYDVATLLVAELRYLESHFPRAPAVSSLIESPPGRKLPAHNYQRAGLLESQLEQLGKQVEAHPDWLKAAKMRRSPIPFD